MKQPGGITVFEPRGLVAFEPKNLYDFSSGVESLTPNAMVLLALWFWMFHAQVFLIIFLPTFLVGYKSTIISSGSNQSLISRSASPWLVEAWITFS